MKAVNLLSLINESENKFKSQVELSIIDNSFYKMIGINREDVDSLSVVVVEWSCELDYTVDGIRGVSIFCPDQEVEVSIEVATEDRTKTVEKVVKIENVLTKESPTTGFYLIPSELEFYKGTWTLNF